MHSGHSMVIAEMDADILAIETDKALLEEERFNARANAIDFIDFHIINRIDGLLTDKDEPGLTIIKQRAALAKYRLEETDSNLFKRLREQISSGAHPQSFFVDSIHKYFGDEFNPPGKVGYDNLDIFINGLLSDQPLPEASIARQPEMVFYQQTPARVIFELAKRATLTPNDVLLDIGSGLGHVPILINLLTGVKTLGVEYEPTYCDYAAACAAKLNLPNVAFINQPAQNACYTEGSVFFMYTPFEGRILRQMLDLLKKESLKRPIRIFTYGPCSPHVALQNWLTCVNGPADDTYTLYEFWG